MTRRIVRQIENEYGGLKNVEEVITDTLQRSTIELFWNTCASHGALIDGYEIKYRVSKTATGRWKSTHSSHARRRWEQDTALSSLAMGTTYDFMIRAKNVSGYGSWSSVQTMTTPPLTASN